MSKKKNHLAFQIFIGLILGVIVGTLLQGHANIAITFIKPIGTLFLNLVKMTIVPLVFASIIAGVCGMGDVKLIGKIGVKTLIYYVCTTAIASIIGLVLANIMHVGATAAMPIVKEGFEIGVMPNVVDTLLNIVPSNPVQALADGNMLQVIVFALFVGGGIMSIGERGQAMKGLVDDFSLIMQNMIGVIMKFAPIGVFALMTPVIAENGLSVLLPLVWLIFAIYLGCFLQLAIVYTVSLKLFTNISPLRFLKAMGEAMLFAYTTASSAATIPFTLQGLEELEIPPHIRNFVVPLGATINMDGTAVFQGICAVFIAGMYGMHLTLSQQVMVVLTVTLASVGTAGVPGAGTIMLGMVLQSIGLPIDGIAVVMGVERILDMARTTINITGDAVCAAVVNGRPNKEEVQKNTN